LAELKEQLFKLRFQHELGQLENAAKLQTIRKDIAKIETILTEMRTAAKA
jgi:large subunit ribosomal protein L29